EAGFDVEQRKGMGQMVAFDALCAGGIDCCVDYTGNFWTTRMKRKEPADPLTTLRAVERYMRDRHGVVCLGRLGFQNNYALAMRRADARKLGVRSIGDLKEHAGQMSIAGDMQFFRVPEWDRIKSRYGLSFASVVPMDPTLMYGALDGGAVQVIVA